MRTPSMKANAISNRIRRRNRADRKRARIAELLQIDPCCSRCRRPVTYPDQALNRGGMTARLLDDETLACPTCEPRIISDRARALSGASPRERPEDPVHVAFSFFRD